MGHEKKNWKAKGFNKNYEKDKKLIIIIDVMSTMDAIGMHSQVVETT